MHACLLPWMGMGTMLMMVVVEVIYERQRERKTMPQNKAAVMLPSVWRDLIGSSCNSAATFQGTNIKSIRPTPPPSWTPFAWTIHPILPHFLTTHTFILIPFPIAFTCGPVEGGVGGSIYILILLCKSTNFSNFLMETTSWS